MSDPLESATALAQLVSAQAHFRDAQSERRDALVRAVRAGAPLRAVAEAAECSHESVRRIVAADGTVIVELGSNEYRLSRQTVELLIYKLAGYGAGAFPRDVQLLGAGSEWLPAAAEMAVQLHAAITDVRTEPIRLHDTWTFALHQVLRLTHMTIPSPLAQLADDLRSHYGATPLHQ